MSDWFMEYRPQPGPVQPITRPGGYIALYGSTGAWRVYRVLLIDMIQPDLSMIVNAGAITVSGGNPTTVTSQATDSVLGTNPGTVTQFRGRVLDPVQYTLYEPGQIPHFVTGSIKTRISPLNRSYDPCDHMTEFWVNGNDLKTQITADVTAPGFFNVNQSRCQFYGVKYVLGGRSPENPRKTLLGGQVEAIESFGSYEEFEDWARGLHLPPGEPKPVLISGYGI